MTVTDHNSVVHLRSSQFSANEEEWIVTNIFLRFFENSSDELGTGKTRHFRKSIVNNHLLIFVTVHSDYLYLHKEI